MAMPVGRTLCELVWLRAKTALMRLASSAGWVGFVR
jgi:hypothetical protein